MGWASSGGAMTTRMLMLNLIPRALTGVSGRQQNAFFCFKTGARQAGKAARHFSASLLICFAAIGTAAAATTVTTLVASRTATVLGETFTLTAMVTAGGAPATGTVTFTDASYNTPLGSATLNETGEASVSVSTLALGAHYLMAEYPGDGELESSVSPFVMHAVAKANSTTTFTVPLDPSDTCHTGQGLIFTANVTAKSPSSGTPTGSVEFTTGGFYLFSGNLVNGKIAIPMNELGEGVHTLAASYSGDANFNASVSSNVQYTVSNGPRLQVNTYKSEYQDHSSVASLTGGGYVVTWSPFEQDGSEGGIYGRLYDGFETPVGKEFRINTYVSGHQTSPSVAGLVDGGFVATWYSQDQDSSGEGVYGQRYDAAGKRKGGEFRINSVTKNNQTDPSVASLPNGGFVVVWMSQNIGKKYLVAKRFNAAGAALGNEINVATTNASAAKVTGLSNGGFVVVWVSEQGKRAIYAKRYSSAGAAEGGVISVALSASSVRGVTSPDVVRMKDGSFVVTWNDYYVYPNGPHSLGQRFTATGAKVGASFHVNTTGGSNWSVTEPLANGGFVVIWRRDQSNPVSLCPNLAGIYGQRYDRFAQRSGAEFIVAGPRSDAAIQPSVAALRKGGFVVTWTDDEKQFFPDYTGIFRRRYD